MEPTVTYKSPLMQWTHGTTDVHNSKGELSEQRFTTCQAAVDYAIMNGWGYDVMYPKFKHHTKKNYADNFAYKGSPKEEAEYD